MSQVLGWNCLGFVSPVDSVVDRCSSQNEVFLWLVFGFLMFWNREGFIPKVGFGFRFQWPRFTVYRWLSWGHGSLTRSRSEPWNRTFLSCLLEQRARRSGRARQRHCALQPCVFSCPLLWWCQEATCVPTSNLHQPHYSPAFLFVLNFLRPLLPPHTTTSLIFLSTTPSLICLFFSLSFLVSANCHPCSLSSLFSALSSLCSHLSVPPTPTPVLRP